MRKRFTDETNKEKNYEKKKYRIGNRFHDHHVRHLRDSGALYLVLNLFGLGIVNYALAQSKINAAA